jgi:hypothetical protein
MVVEVEIQVIEEQQYLFQHLFLQYHQEVILVHLHHVIVKLWLLVFVEHIQQMLQQHAEIIKEMHVKQDVNQHHHFHHHHQQQHHVIAKDKLEQLVEQHLLT